MAYVRDSSEDLVWDEGSGQYVPAVQQYTFTVTPTPSDAVVALSASGYSQSGNSITVDDGVTVNWSVTKIGYETKSGQYTVNGSDYNMPVTILQTAMLAINPAPNDATVVLTAAGFTQINNTITVTVGTSVQYTVSKIGYVTQTNTVTVTQDDMLNISLSIVQCSLTVNATPVDADITLSAPNYTDVTGQGTATITVDYGTSVSYTVEKSGYATQQYIYSALVADTTTNVNLSQNKVILRVIPTPSEATVVLTSTGAIQSGNMIEVDPGSDVNWSVSLSGYEPKSGTVTNIQANQNLDITLKQLFTLTVNPTPADATVVLSATGYTQNNNTITVSDGTSVTYTVSKQDYNTQSSTVVVTADQTLNITLLQTYCTLTVVPTPSDATVVLTSSGGTQSGNAITVTNGSSVTYTVSKTGYTTATNTITLTTDRTLNVEIFNYCTYTVNPIPANATVLLVAAGCTQVGNAITVPANTVVTWTVSATGYVTKTGTKTITTNLTETIAIPSQSSNMDPVTTIPAGSPSANFGNTDIRTDVIELLQDKIDAFQGIAEQGRILAVDSDGYVKLSQGVPGLILSWGQIGGVLSDQVDLQNVLNLKALDSDVVHKENNVAESITGDKIFKNILSYQDAGMDETTTPTNVRIKDIYITDTNNVQLARFGFRQEVDNRHSAEIVTQKTIGSGFYKAFFKNNIDTSGNGWLEYDINVEGTGTATNLSLTKNSVTSTDKTIPTMGWCNNDTGINNLVHKTGNETIGGVKTFTSGISGTATSALWADLAEQYVTDEKYPAGTLIKFGGEKDITIADDEVNGVISDKPGFLLDYKLEDSLPVALAGKTPIRIIGKVNKFDRITLSEIPGVGKVAEVGDIVIARALESSDNEEEKLVNCVTKFIL